jgi:DNA-directed RNA polymerase specialized sigma24 family protein
LRQGDAHVINDPPTAGDGVAGDGEVPGFEAFVRAAEPALRHALVAAYGHEDGREAAAEALAYAWEHWDRVSQMPNPAGYLFVVARSSAAKSRRWRRPAPPVFAVPADAEHVFEPGLPAALAALSERQRIAVVLGVGFGYTLREIADLTGTKVTTVQNHLERGLRRLRERLGADLPARRRDGGQQRGSEQQTGQAGGSDGRQ